MINCMGEKGRTIVVTLIFSIFLMLAILSPICQSVNEEEEIAGTPAGWTDDINLSNNSTAWDQYPSICSRNDTVHVTWINDDDVLYRKSDDGGRSWSSAITLYQSGFFSMYTDIDVSGQIVHAVWGDKEGWDGIYYRNSTDNGDTWNSVKRISADGVNSNGPLIFVNNSNIHIIWWDQRDGANGEIYYRRSLDGGITWDNGQGVDIDRRVTFSPSATGNIAFAGSGSNLSVIWSDERNGNFDIYWMISKDNGNTWEDGLGTPNIGRQLTIDATDSMWNAIAMSGSDIHIVWMDESWPGPAYRVYYRNSTDMGVTWNPIQLLTGPSPLMASPDIAVCGNIVHVTWDDARDDGSTMDIYYKNSTDSGISWNGDTRLTYNEGNHSYHPRIAPTESVIQVTWWDDRDGLAEIYYKRYPDFPPYPTYNITLHEGWNLISTPLTSRDDSINEVLENITGKWDVVKYYSTLDKADPWKTYRVGSSVNDLANIDNTMGFWIYINQPNVTLTVSGINPTSTSISLYAGWNLVGYPTQTTETVGNALWGTGADRVEVFDPVSPYIKEVEPTYIMKPGEGYWIHVPADTTWVINW